MVFRHRRSRACSTETPGCRFRIELDSGSKLGYNLGLALQPIVSPTLLLDRTVKERRPIPACCKVCTHYGVWQWDEWHDRAIFNCRIGIWLPYKKQICKKHEPKVVDGTEAS
jgi:hypothetical protein